MRHGDSLRSPLPWRDVDTRSKQGEDLQDVAYAGAPIEVDIGWIRNHAPFHDRIPDRAVETTTGAWTARKIAAPVIASCLCQIVAGISFHTA
jgi:hypothetical protein